MKSLALNVDVTFHSADIDAQHRELVEAMGRLLREADSRDEARAAKALVEFIQFINSYFLFHTFTEEKLMFDNGYPRDAYFHHVREHKEMIIDLVNLMDGKSPRNRLHLTATRPTERALQLIDTFNQWLHDHIGQVDSKLMRFLRAKGI